MISVLVAYTCIEVVGHPHKELDLVCESLRHLFSTTELAAFTA